MLAVALGSAQALGAGGATRPQCARGETTATEGLACDLARGLGALGDGTVIAVAPFGTTPDGPGKLGAALARELGSGAAPLGATTLPAARALAKTAKRIVFVTVELRAGRARATADVRSPKIGFWDRVRGVKDESRATATAIRPIDGGLGSGAPPPLGRPTVARVKVDVPDVVALACGELTDDGPPAVLVVGRRRVSLGRIDGAAFRVLASAEWPSLAPVAASPLREPIAVAEIPGDGTLHIGTTDRDHGLVLGADLHTVARLPGLLPVRFAGCLSRTKTAVGVPVPCTASDPPGMLPRDVAVDAIASGTSVTPAGALRRILAHRTPDGALAVQDDGGRKATLPAAGGAIAVADLDRDGAPELATSEDTDAPAADAVVVRTFGADGALTERERLAAPGGVRALAACPPDGPGRSPLLVATRGELWVVR